MPLDASIRKGRDLGLNVIQVRLLLPFDNHAQFVHELVLLVGDQVVQEFEHFVHLVWELHDVVFRLFFSFLGLLFEVAEVLAEIINSFEGTVDHDLFRFVGIEGHGVDSEDSGHLVHLGLVESFGFFPL
jgi:hypothetical protein